MRRIRLILALGIVAASTHAAVVTYNFNDDASGYAGADTAGFSGTASDITLVDGNGTADLTNTGINSGNTASGTITDGTDTFAAMAPGASSDLDTDGDPDTADGSGYLGFTLTPEAGESLDFSELSYQASIASYTTVDAGAQETRAALWYSVDGGAFTQIGSTLILLGNADADAGTEVYQNLSGTQLVTYDIGAESGGLYTWDSLDISLGSLGVLAADESIEFRLAVNNSLINGFRFGTVVEDIVLSLPPAVTPTAPVSNDNVYGLDVDSIFTNASFSVLYNDTDANGDALTAIQLTAPTNGTLLSFSTNGTFVYQPDSEFTGTDSFTYEATDGGLTGNVATVTLSVGYEMSVANLFSDHMVLQRDQKIPVWGKGNPGEVLEVVFGSQTNSVTVDGSGDWKAWLDPMVASTNPATLSITGPRGTFAFANILVGDVWVCSGQSNMDRSLDIGNPPVTNAAAEIAAANYPNIRLMTVPLNNFTNQLDDLPAPATWNVCSSNTVGNFSGTGYFFGREIHQEVGVPIGLIESAVGGTRIERWMPEDLRAEIGYTYDDRLTQLYNGMIHPLTGLPIKGAIWYQGESNAYDTPEVIALYKELLESMILGWRDVWGVGEFPVYFAQICPHNRGDVLRVPAIWDAFTRTLSIPNTGLISLNDLNNYTNGVVDISEVHPSNKQDVGLRFGLLALEKTYGGITNIAYTGPLFDSAVATGTSVRVHFDPDTLGSGLAPRDALPLILFELAGANEVYYTNATATIDGDTILVSHASVAVPAFIRFGYNGNVPHNFMNAEGFPVNTFAAEVKTQSPPVAHPDLYEVSAGGSGLLDVLVNDTDIEGDVLTATLVSNALHGTLIATNGMFLYAPTNGFQGTDRFTYMADDGTDDSQIVMVSVMVVEPVYPELILPSILGSNRVLQRNQPIPVWGWGPAGQTVTVELSSGQTTNTVIDAEGKWETTLPSMSATTNALTLTISTTGSSVTQTNLVVGDVWLASGQSNAGWRLLFTDGGAEEVAIANHPLLRLFYTSKHPTNTPQDDIVSENDPSRPTAEWSVCIPEVASGFSAIGYYFGRDLQQNLDIPIGIIQSAYAGTAVESWSKSVLPNALDDSSLFIPAHELYNGMIHPLLNAPISGAIWIQGENNRWDGFAYAEKLTQAVTEWRTLWGVGDFPFYYVQIPPKFDYEDDPMYPLFLEGQAEVENTLVNSRMVVISDTTDGSGYHPKNKVPVGARLAVCALKNTYGQTGLVDSGPRFSSAVIEGSTFRVSFSDLGGGLAINSNIGYNANGDFQTDIYEDLNGNRVLDDGEDADEDGHLDTGEDLNNNGVLDAGEDLDQDGILDYSELDINMPDLIWFELCGADGVFTNALAVIDGGTLVVSSPSVLNPIGIRYAWSKSAIGNLMNVDGLPAGSFRLVPPLAMAESYGLHEGTELYVEPAGVLGNDLAGSSHLPIQFPILGNNVTSGTLMLRDDGAFIYEPLTGFTGTDQFTYAVTDGAETSPETTVTLDVFASNVGTEQINRDVWTGIDGYLVSELTGSPSYPESPNERGFISSLDAPQNWGDDYGQRIYGYLHPPTNGNYTFYISSSARSEFWLSTDENPANIVQVCSSLDRTPGDWTAAASSVALVGGQRYYIEVLHKENGGNDHVQVAWDVEGVNTTNIVAGSYLSGFPVEAPPATSYAGWSSWNGVSGDGYIIDFAFNLDLTTGDDPVMVPSTGTMGLPYWQVSTASGFAVEYLRRKDAPGTTYVVQFTDSLLAPWEDSARPEIIVPINSTWERVSVEDAVGIADATNRFGRVIVIQD